MNPVINEEEPCVISLGEDQIEKEISSNNLQTPITLEKEKREVKEEATTKKETPYQEKKSSNHNNMALTPKNSEIAHPTHLFLQDEGHFEEKKEDYSLAIEFAKAKKNKSFLFYFIVLSFIGLLGWGTYVMSEEIQKQSRRMNFNIADFEDLNLSDMLNKAKETEKELALLRQELEASKDKMEAEINRIKQEAAQKIQLVLTRKLPKKQEDQLIKQIKNEEAEAIWNLKLFHENQMKEKEKAISKVQDKLGNYEKKLQKDFQKEKDGALLDQNRLHNLELETLKKTYENRITQLTIQNQKDLDNLKKYHNQLMTEIQKNYDNRISLLEQNNLKSQEELKQKQTLFEQEALKTTQKIKELEKKYQDQGNILKESSHHLAQKSALVENYQFALSTFTQTHKENGFILDARNLNRMLVVVHKSYQIKEGDKGVIINDADQKIADVQFFFDQGQLWAFVLNKNEIEIEPFFRILILLKES